jgi:response regulator RpfG family c-di-GMP phosphodiesterase
MNPASSSHSMSLLVVDDDPAVLDAVARLLRADGIRVSRALGGEQAIAYLEEYAASTGAIMTDYAMPGMNGAELLRIVRKRWPDLVRLLLTGNADLAAAARAVNEGHVSRLFTKPWQPDQLRQAVAEALEQHELVLENRRLRELADEQSRRLELWNQQLESLVSERTAEVGRTNLSLQRALLDTVRLMVGFLDWRLPQRADRCRKVARLAGRLAQRAGMSQEEVRQVQVAALVHDVGLLGLPDALLHRPPAELLPGGRSQYQRHPVLGQTLLSSVEQLAQMGLWIRHHHERWDGKGYPDGLGGPAIPMPARLIALADGHLEAVELEGGTAQRWRQLQRGTVGAFDPNLVPLLDAEIMGRPMDLAPGDERLRSIADLAPGMVLAEPITTVSGAVLLRSSEVLTAEHVARVRKLQSEGVLSKDSVEIESQAPVSW